MARIWGYRLGEAPQAVLLEALGGRHAALAEELMVKIGEVMGFFDVAKPMPFLYHKPPAPNHHFYGVL